MRTQTQFDTTPELKRQIKLLMAHEDYASQAELFLQALDHAWGDKYPDLRKQIQAALQPR